MSAPRLVSIGRGDDTHEPGDQSRSVPIHHHHVPETPVAVARPRPSPWPGRPGPLQSCRSSRSLGGFVRAEWGEKDRRCLVPEVNRVRYRQKGEGGIVSRRRWLCLALRLSISSSLIARASATLPPRARSFFLGLSLARPADDGVPVGGKLRPRLSSPQPAWFDAH